MHELSYLHVNYKEELCEYQEVDEDSINPTLRGLIALEKIFGMHGSDERKNKRRFDLVTKYR